MAKYLKDVLGKNTTTKKTNDLGGYKPKAGDEEKFAKKHEIEVHDRTPAEEHQFKGGTKEASFPKQSEGVYESKKAEDVSCNQTPAGTKCPMHEMADCTAVRNIKEGAKVDRMVAHVKSSEKAAGKSDKKAENIAWATANKRGMLDNKNKKTNEANAVEPLLQGDKPSGHSNEAAEMAKAELKALANKALHLVMQMPESMHVEPWCQAKIAQAKSMIYDVHDYMIYGNHEEEDEQADSQMQITPAASPGNTLVNPAGDPDRGRIV